MEDSSESPNVGLGIGAGVVEDDRGSKVWLSVSRKVNLGNYESIGIDLGGSAPVLDGETRRDVLRRLYSEYTEELAEMLVIMEGDPRLTGGGK